MAEDKKMSVSAPAKPFIRLAASEIATMSGKERARRVFEVAQSGADPKLVLLEMAALLNG